MTDGHRAPTGLTPRTRQAIRGRVAGEFPRLAARRLLRAPTRTVVDPCAVVLGRNQMNNAPVLLPVRPRLEHMHVIGTTGGGKTTLLEHCIRQDIALGHGVCVVDPHGSHPASLYRSLLAWLDESGLRQRRTVHIVDPNAPSHTVGFNPLEHLPDTDLAVIAGTTLEAFEQVWGEDSQAKPTIRRVLLATFTALAELGLTLAEADLLFDPDDGDGVRAYLVDRLQDRFARRVFRRLHQLSRDDRTRRDFVAEVVGPENRLAEFIRSAGIRNILGQTRHTLDLRAALDEGHVILVNLAGGSRVYEADAELLGRLLTRFLFFHAVRRREPSRPFFFYLDECQRYLSGDVERLLGEVRKFGVGCVLSHQWQQQLVNGDDESILAAVQNATNLKAVFRVKSVKEAAELAETVIPLDLEMPVKALIKPTVVGHKRTLFRSRSKAEHEAYGTAVAEGHSESISEGWSDSEATGFADTMMSGSTTGQATGAVMDGANGWVAMPNVISFSSGQSSGISSVAGSSSNDSSGSSHSESVTTSHNQTTIQSEMHGTSQSEGESEGLEPVYADLPAAVHSKDNALYLAATTLRSLKTGQAFINYVGASGMVSALLLVPRVQTLSLPDAAFDALRRDMLAASPSAIGSAVAADDIAERERALFVAAGAGIATIQPPDEPESFRVPAPKKRRMIASSKNRD